MASPARQRRPVAFLAFLAAVIMAIVVAVQFYGRQSGHSRQPLPLAGGECRRLPRVKRYVPSAWEAEWYAAGRAVTANDSAPCTMLTDNPDHVEAWVEGAAAGAEALNSGELDPQVFSTFVFEDPCLPEARITAAIEPLVGHFRCGGCCCSVQTACAAAAAHACHASLGAALAPPCWWGARILQRCDENWSDRQHWFVAWGRTRSRPGLRQRSGRSATNTQPPPTAVHCRHPKAPNCLGEAAPVGIQAR